MKKLIFILLYSLITTSANAASLDDVAKAFENKDFVLVIQLATPLADQGSIDAQYLNGLYLLKGEGELKKNPEKAVYYLKKCASNSGKPEIMGTPESVKGMCNLLLYNAYINGKGVERDVKQAGLYLGVSARLGNEKAISLATSLYCEANDHACAFQLRENLNQSNN